MMPSPMYLVSLGLPMEPVATKEHPDTCKFFKRQRDKHVATISVQGTNEDTLTVRMCFFYPRTHTESCPDWLTSS